MPPEYLELKSYVMPQLGASLTIVIATLAETKARRNKTFIALSSLTIVTYDPQNIFIVQATET
jgi:hypothetical protein